MVVIELETTVVMVFLAKKILVLVESEDMLTNRVGLGLEAGSNARSTRVVSPPPTAPTTASTIVAVAVVVIDDGNGDGGSHDGRFGFSPFFGMYM